MNADRRIVPEKHVSSVLAEEHTPKRALEIKNTLKESGSKLDNVAHKWIEHNGMNSLGRVMINNVHGVPQKKSQTPVHSTLGHEAHHGHDAHGHGHEAHHGHDAHGHGHEAHHGHDAHGHGHEAHHGHEHQNGITSFINMGHRCGEYWQHIFGLIGRLLGEIVWYCARLLIITMLFWPTRTALLIVVVGYIINTLAETELPILGLWAAWLLVHLIFYAIAQISGGWGEHGLGHGGWSEHGGHWHH